MRRRPPRSTRTDTLFPYTTLFRSRQGGVDLLGRLADATPIEPPGDRVAVDPEGVVVRQQLFPQRRDIAHREVVRGRSEEHTSELQSLMRISYAVFCLKKKKKHNTEISTMRLRKYTQRDTQ